MAWNNRIREAALTSHSGKRFPFGYEDVSMSIDKKTTGFNFPDADGTYVQDLGKTGRKYPFRIFFSGEDYDIKANAFMDALLEKGIMRLEHPLYGVVNVIPFGSIGRRDNLKTQSNQAVFELTFWETIALVYPLNIPDPGQAVSLAVEAFNGAAGAEYGDSIVTKTVLSEVTLKDQVLGFVGAISTGFKDIVALTTAVQKQFNSIVSSINNGIDFLIKAPLDLAAQIDQLIQAPGRALANIKARLSGFRNVLDSLLYGTGTSAVGTGSGEKVISISKDANDLRTNDLVAQAYVTGSIVSVINNQFTTKTEAIEAAEEILTQFDDVVEWRDTNFETLGVIDTGGSYQKLQEAVAIVTGFLVQISFDLKQERSIVLDRNRTIVDLEGEIYRTNGENLDFMIVSNDLSGDEIIELPLGREILYYV